MCMVWSSHNDFVLLSKCLQHHIFGTVQYQERTCWRNNVDWKWQVNSHKSVTLCRKHICYTYTHCYDIIDLPWSISATFFTFYFLLYTCVDCRLQYSKWYDTIGILYGFVFCLYITDPIYDFRLFIFMIHYT